jgi:hypothetical protein
MNKYPDVVPNDGEFCRVYLKTGEILKASFHRQSQVHLNGAYFLETVKKNKAKEEVTIRHFENEIDSREPRVYEK